MSNSRDEGSNGNTSCNAPSPSASTNTAPSSLSSMAGRPVSSSFPSRPANSLYSPNTIARASSSFEEQLSGHSENAYTTSTCTVGTTRSELLSATNLGTAFLELVVLFDGFTNRGTPLSIFILT